MIIVVASRQGFVHLHAHTEYSAQDGTSHIPDMAQQAAADGQIALANTDHGNISGAWKLGKHARLAGIKPIVGVEAYLAIGDRQRRDFDRVPRDLMGSDGGSGEVSGRLKNQAYQHLGLLSATPVGFSNLSAMVSSATETVYHKPRIDYTLLAERSAGIIALTGCVSGPVAGALLRDGTLNEDGSIFDGKAAAKAAIITLRDIFGRDRLLVEVMDHGIPAERRVTAQLFDLARRAGLKAVATNDSHYTSAADAATHDLWMCIGETSRQGAGKPPYKLTDTNRWRFTGTGYHLRSTAEMYEVFAGTDAGLAALRQTVAVAEMIEDNVLPASTVRLPQFSPLGKHATSDDMLWAMVNAGADLRFGANWRTRRPDVAARIDREVGIVVQLGFADYFLIVEDMVAWARSEGIRVGPGRGSAAGSLVAFALRITNIDPLANGLLFERFLDPSRTEPPDIDTDFEPAGQQRVFHYLVHRWGEDNVARLGTFGYTRARAAIKDAAKAIISDERYLKVGADLAGRVPKMGFTLRELLDPACPDGEPIRLAMAADPEARAVIDGARCIEGTVKQDGLHACGIVVSSAPLVPVVPLRWLESKGSPDGFWVTSWDGTDVAQVGLLKLDALGLRNLAVVSAAVQQVKTTRNLDIDPDTFPTDPADPQASATWAMLGAGRTAGVFQLESSAMADLCQKIQPDCVNDLSVISALWRPGPISAGYPDLFALRKRGVEEVDYGIFTDDPVEQALLRPVLDETFGLIVYQEQLMKVGAVVAGFGPVDTSRLRRAVSKKKKDEMAQLSQEFFDAAQTETTDADGNVTKIAFKHATVQALWSGINGAADYSFVKAHARAYAEMSYQTAFLKANYLPEFSAALLSCTEDDERRAATMMDMRAEGVTILGPSVVNGPVHTSADRNGVVRIGLSEIKRAGQVGQVIVQERERGRFAFPNHEAPHDRPSIQALYDRMRKRATSRDEPFTLTTSALMALIDSGALDDFGPRKGMVAMVGAIKCPHFIAVPDMEYSTVERTARERTAIGVVVSKGPLAVGQQEIRAWGTPGRNHRPVQIQKVPSQDGSDVLTLGVLASCSVSVKGGKERAAIVLEGSRKLLSGMIWDRAFAKLAEGGGIPPVGSVVAVRGRVRMVEVPMPPTDDGETTDGVEVAIVEKRKELSVWEMWPVRIDDDSRTNLPTVDLQGALAQQPVPGAPEPPKAAGSVAATGRGRRSSAEPSEDDSEVSAEQSIPATEASVAKPTTAQVSDLPPTGTPVPPPLDEHAPPEPGCLSGRGPVKVLITGAGRTARNAVIPGGVDAVLAAHPILRKPVAMRATAHAVEYSRSRPIPSSDGSPPLVVVVMPAGTAASLSHCPESTDVTVHVMDMAKKKGVPGNLVLPGQFSLFEIPGVEQEPPKATTREPQQADAERPNLDRGAAA